MGRAPCCDKTGLKKGPWTPEEDHKLIDYIQKHGYGNWRTLPKNAGLQRCGKSCRLRWTNYLRPDIKRGRFSFEEEETIIQLHSVLGNKWSAIASRLPGRTDNEIKNYWNTHIRKRLLRMGIDPVTHSPTLDLVDLSSILINSSLYNPSSLHMNNLSRILAGINNVNPQILRLATSLLSSQPHDHDQNFNTQNVGQENYHPCSPQIQNQISQLFSQTRQIQEAQPCSSYPFSSDQAPQFNNLVEPNAGQYPPNLTNFISSENSDQLNGWQSNYNGVLASSLAQDQYNVPDHDQPCYNNTSAYNNYGCDDHNNQTIIDPTLSETSTFQHSNNSNQSLNLASVLSTPSSSPTPLASNSTYMSTEDESRDNNSYVSTNMLKFEIPDMFLGVHYDHFM